MKYALLTAEEQQLFRIRLAVLGGIAVLVLLGLLFRIWFMQIVAGEYYQEVARGNRIRVIPQEAPRGLIYDRHGRLLAYNRPAFNVQLIPEDTPDLEATLRNLSYLTGYPVDDLYETVEANRSPLKFKPLVLLEDIGRKTADLVETYQADLPGISVAVEPKRLYPTAFTASHVIGYVGQISRSQLESLPLNKVRSGRIVGQAGIELIQNQLLIGTDGGRQVEVDHVGRELRVIGEPVNPVPGADTYLTIDLDLQQFVKSLMTELQGVVIVMRTRTGEILSMVSQPDFDPNRFVGRIDEREWRELTQAQDKVLINKAVQGIYPPGSAFKMVIAAAGLDLGIIDETTTFNCPGYHRLGRDIRYCWRRGGHGDVNVVEAITQSCNVFFYQLGLEVGVDRIHEYARLFGFGEQVGVELESEKTGLLPSREWKRRAVGERWYHGETMHLAIGQGYLTVTPMQLLAYVNTIANRGVWVQPTVVRRMVAPDGTLMRGEDDLPRNTRLLPLPPAVFEPIREGMFQVINSRKGTARRAYSRHVAYSGKTGTSQVVGRRSRGDDEEEPEKDELPHSIFVAYAPAVDPEISIAVLVEHGESGGETAAPLARRVVEYYFREMRAPGPGPGEAQASVSRAAPAPDTAPAVTHTARAPGTRAAHPFTDRLSRAFGGRGAAEALAAGLEAGDGPATGVMP